MGTRLGQDHTMGECPSKWVAGGLVFGVVSLSATLGVFLAVVLTNFQAIIQRYTTISAYAADPTSFANRLLSAVTFVAGYGLVFLLLLEDFAGVPEIHGYGWAVCSGLALPLVGVFYTDGRGRFTKYPVGIWGIPYIPIWVSTLIHTIAASFYFLALPIMSSIYAWSLPEGSVKDALFWANVVTWIAFILFSVTQNIIAAAIKDADKKKEDKEAVVHHPPPQSGKGFLTAPKLPSTRRPVGFACGFASNDHRLYAVSFLSESVLVIVSTYTAWYSSFHRNSDLNSCFPIW